ncbi:MAG: hypothetical protein E7223_02075 [Clostridiales bacterium]|nr:hypothetical protein [Clostridiales bacterium]
MKKMIALVLAMILCFSLASCSSGGANPQGSNDPNQTDKAEYVAAIHFTINPEFELQLDSSNSVVNLECLNDDAEKLFSDADIIGMDGLAAIDVLLTTVFSSGVVSEAVTVNVSSEYQEENEQASRMTKEIPSLVLDVKAKTGFPHEVSVELTDPHPENTAAWKQNVLYRADFEIPDVHSTGYTNLIDFYNAFPDGTSGGTFANAGLMVHYRQDMDHDLSQADSLAFRTYRGIGLGSTQKEVFDAYGTKTPEPPFPEIMGIGDAQHTVTSFVEYQARITSGACVALRFYFDQNDTVMHIDYHAVYRKYAGNVSDSALSPLENE